MIRNSFIFLENIGEKKEKNLWKKGIRTWEGFLAAERIDGIAKWRKSYYDRQIKKAKENLYNLNSEYFYELLPRKEHWRLYEFFKEEAVFLDIETNGLEEEADVTVVGLFDGLNTKTMVKGINMDFNQLRNELKNYKLVITFNGAAFDLPFIKKRHSKVLPDLPHFDLRFACKRIGLTGGLKEIEKRVGIRRNKVVEGIYGGDASALWRMWRGSGDDYYLKLLIEYNEEDVINLRTIADHVYFELKKSVFA
jgi:hypothetical protein